MGGIGKIKKEDLYIIEVYTYNVYDNIITQFFLILDVTVSFRLTVIWIEHILVIIVKISVVSVQDEDTGIRRTGCSSSRTGN